MEYGYVCLTLLDRTKLIKAKCINSLFKEGMDRVMMNHPDAFRRLSVASRLPRRMIYRNLPGNALLVTNKEGM